MKKRLLCLLLALILTLSLLSMQVFAKVGATGGWMMYGGAVPVVTKLEGTNGGSQIWSMKVADKKGGTPNGEGIEFYLAINGPHAGKSVTSSARYHHQAYTMDSINLGVYEQARFTLQTGNQQKELKLEKMEVIDPKKEPGFDNYFPYEVPDNGALTVRCTFSGYGRGEKEVMCYISYHIAKLGDGVTDGTWTSQADNTENSHTYAVVARAAWGPGGVATDNFPSFTLRYFQDFRGFSRMGHARGEANSAHVLISQDNPGKQDNSRKQKSTDVTAGLGRSSLWAPRVGEGQITEVYSDSYGVDNPFLLADWPENRDAGCGDLDPTRFVAYDAKTDCLTAESRGATIGTGTPPYVRVMHVWGFRDVYSKNEGQVEDPKFTEPDKVTIPQNASKLGLYQSGGGVVVAALTDEVITRKLQTLYGDPICTLRGNFKQKSDATGKYYEFTDNKLALTSTITATWPAGDHFYVRVDENGLLTSFDTTSMVQYSTPTFKLYWGKQTDTPPAKLTVEDGLLTLNMKPSDNAVLVFIDIPQVSSLINKAQLKPDGNIILSGQMGLDLILNCSPDQLLTLHELGYGPKGAEFKQNGINATGKLDTASLLGLELGKLEANINTFQGREVYDFSLELNAFDLFETEANLELKRLNNGRLVPNKLYFFLAVQPGIPIAPPVPTAFLRGGGGGFDGLAATINGDFIGIPPISLKLTAAGDYLKVLKGRLHLTLGPSYLEYAGTNIQLAGADVVDSYKMYLRLTGEERTYLGVKYTGVRAGGGMGLVLKAPQGDAAIFEVDTNIEASMFGGLDNYKTPNWAYLQLDSRGSIKATVKTPKKIGKLDLGKIGGRTLASADADFILGGQTSMQVAKGTSFSDAAKSAWDNLSIYGGLSHTGKFALTHWRIFYVIPDHVGGAFHLFRNINAGWSLEQEIDKNAWYVGGGRSASTQVTSIPLGVLRDDETGEQVGIAVMETSLFELPVAETQDALYAVQGADGRYSETITSPHNSGADTLLIQLFPKDDATLAELKNALEITLPDGSPLTLVDPIITGNVFTNPDDANCTDIVDDELGEGLLIATGLPADIEQTFTVEADCDFTYVLSASAKPTTLSFSLSGRAAESTIANKRDGKTYAVRYYLDTEPDRSGEHYFLDMIESEPFGYAVPADGSLAPTGEYHVTAVLVDRITGDFNGDGEIGEDEYSWVTVDTATSTATISYTNVNTPSEPTNVTLVATGNETLTASWTAVDDADGYRVTLYYEEGGEWKQAGAPYELENADFAANSSQPAATISGSIYSLRMAPTVHGKELEITGTENPSVTGTGAAYDDAPTGVNYRATVESFKRDANASGEDGALDTRYYSNAVASRPTNLPAYTPKAITVTASNGQEVTLNADNGYDTLTWKALPDGTLFTIDSYDGSFTVEIAPEPGTGTFTVGANGDVTADDDGKALIEGSGRVKLTVTEGNDTTEYYLRLTLDDIAPVVTLDNENVAADPNTGKYAITGTTEPGLSVKLTIPRATEQNDDAEDEVVTATADDTGRFTIPGVLTRNSGTDPSETAGFESLLGKVTAQDSMGNLSDPAAVIVTPREQWTPPENPSSPSGGSSSTGGKRPSEQEHEEESPFRDVFESDWFYEDVLFAHSEGLLKGTAKRTFSPYASTTRAMIATVLWRMDGSPKADADSRFTDVAGGQWYSSAVAWANENGIVRGFGDGTFAPNAPVTREQFAAMLYRYAQYSGERLQIETDLTDFKDAGTVSSWARDAMRWAVSNGIITGKPGKLLDPQGTATRAEIAAMLRRFLKT